MLLRLMPAVLHALADRMELLTHEVYLLSAVTALQRVTETLPHFISPYLQDTTLQVRCLRKSSVVFLLVPETCISHNASRERRNNIINSSSCRCVG